jgi:hypothetical protein
MLLYFMEDEYISINNFLSVHNMYR